MIARIAYRSIASPAASALRGGLAALLALVLLGSSVLPCMDGASCGGCSECSGGLAPRSCAARGDSECQEVAAQHEDADCASCNGDDDVRSAALRQCDGHDGGDCSAQGGCTAPCWFCGCSSALSLDLPAMGQHSALPSCGGLDTSPADRLIDTDLPPPFQPPRFA